MIPCVVDQVLAKVVDCDLALELLRVLSRSGSVEERELARLSIDDLLERRYELSAGRADAA